MNLPTNQPETNKRWQFFRNCECEASFPWNTTDSEGD